MELQAIQKRIFELRGVKVMLDFHLAELYGTETRVLKQAVKRNIQRFPSDFLLELSPEEWREVITSCDNLLPARIKFSPVPPFAFTEQGVAMLSSVLRSQKAIDVNIGIMRAFVMLRQHLTDHKGLKEKIAVLEGEMNRKFKDVNEVLRYLLSPAYKRREIGFRQKGRK